MSYSRALALIAALALLTVTAPTHADDPSPAVTATGEGKIDVAPDTAWLGFGISARQATVAEARDEVARGVARLIALARDSGLKDEHIATAALNVNPEFDWHPETRERRLLGYVVSRQITLRLTDLARLGELTERALGLGVTEASPAVFDTSRRGEIEAEALAAAARAARARAEVMATALGVGVGAPLQIEAGGAAAPPRPMMRMAIAESDAMSGAETYQPGLIRITASVTARFALLER
ncbi:MAG TPA: SIMPL domain-containing protein [Gammaproteobacteria bacterium]|nr:SIMPL domain-containing protein [Gammaproteobacteria bacterium]